MATRNGYFDATFWLLNKGKTDHFHTYYYDTNNTTDHWKHNTVDYTSYDAKELCENTNCGVIRIPDLMPLDAMVNTIRKVEGTDRDYMIGFYLNGLYYNYVVMDCNHENHAYNRFAKRVREVINVKLGTSISVVDYRVTGTTTASPVNTVFDLYINLGLGTTHVCGHDDPFWLMQKAIIKAFDQVRPVEFQIRDARGNIKVFVDENGARFNEK
jgi:hypothetical protein